MFQSVFYTLLILQRIYITHFQPIQNKYQPESSHISDISAHDICHPLCSKELKVGPKCVEKFILIYNSSIAKQAFLIM